MTPLRSSFLRGCNTLFLVVLAIACVPRGGHGFARNDLLTLSEKYPSTIRECPLCVINQPWKRPSLVLYGWDDNDSIKQPSKNNNIDNKENDGGLVVNGIFAAVDQVIALFVRPSKEDGSVSPLSLLLPPPGFVLVWLTLARWAPAPQLFMSVALYIGSFLLVQQIFQDDDISLDNNGSEPRQQQQDVSIFSSSKQEPVRINGEANPLAQVPSRDSSSNDETTLEGITDSVVLVDLFCFVASLALGTILTVGARDEPSLFALVTSSPSNLPASSSIIRDLSDSPQVNGPDWGLILLGTAMLGGVGFWTVVSQMPGNTYTDATSNTSSLSNQPLRPNGEEQDPNKLLLQMWDDQLRQNADSKNSNGDSSPPSTNGSANGGEDGGGSDRNKNPPDDDLLV